MKKMKKMSMLRILMEIASVVVVLTTTGSAFSQEKSIWFAECRHLYLGRVLCRQASPDVPRLRPNTLENQDALDDWLRDAGSRFGMNPGPRLSWRPCGDDIGTLCYLVPVFREAPAYPRERFWTDFVAVLEKPPQPPRPAPPPQPTYQAQHRFDCRDNGRVVFTEPGTPQCFDFKKAAAGAEFEHNGWIYKWDPRVTVELSDFISEQKRLNLARPVKTATTVVRDVDPRSVKPRPNSAPDTQASSGNQTLDCISCLNGKLRQKNPGTIATPICEGVVQSSCSFPVVFNGYFLGDDGERRGVGGTIDPTKEASKEQTSTSMPCGYYKNAKFYPESATLDPNYRGLTTGCKHK